MKFKNIRISKTFLAFGFITLILGIIAQCILPLIFPEYFQHGLTTLLKDPVGFHLEAIEQAEKLRKVGWSVFDWTPQNQYPSGLLSLFYYVTGIYSPLWYLLINGLFVGLTALIIEKILKFWVVLNKWHFIGIFFIIFTTTSVGWNTQISKDVILVFAFLAILRAYIGLFLEKDYRSILYYFLGAWLIYLLKDHWLEILLSASIITFLIGLIHSGNRSKRYILQTSLITVVLIIGVTYSINYFRGVSNNSSLAQPQVAGETDVQVRQIFHYDSQFPLFDLFLRRLSYGRFSFLVNYSHAKENFLPNLKIESTSDALNYIPHAIQFTFFEPLPWKSRWSESRVKGLIYLFLQLEQITVYAAFLVIGLVFFKIRKVDRIIVIGLFAMILVFNLVFGFATPNLGAICRYRFPFLMILKIMAMCYWPNLRSHKNLLTSAS